MKYILGLRHWQLFVLIIVLGVISGDGAIEQVCKMISIIVLSWWLYAIGFYGQLKINDPNNKLSKIGLFQYNAILIPVLALILMQLPGNYFDYRLVDLATYIISNLLVLCFVFAVIHNMVYASKTMGILESQSKARFENYVKYLVLFFILFVGIWVIQPKVRKIFKLEY